MIMNLSTKLLATTGALLMSVSVCLSADENYNHFPSMSSPDLKTALCNLSSYNQRLMAIKAKDELTAVDMVKIHELTYTLENAIQRMQQELTTIAADLEEVHLASERMDKQAIAQYGKRYMSQSQMFLDSLGCK